MSGFQNTPNVPTHIVTGNEVGNMVLPYGYPPAKRTAAAKSTKTNEVSGVWF